MQDCFWLLLAAANQHATLGGGPMLESLRLFLESLRLFLVWAPESNNLVLSLRPIGLVRKYSSSASSATSLVVFCL